MEKERNKSRNQEGAEGELYQEFLRLKPVYQDKDSAIAAILAQLEKVAGDAGLTVEAFLKDAHTTQRSSAEHTLALQLERQLNFLRR